MTRQVIAVYVTVLSLGCGDEQDARSPDASSSDGPWGTVSKVNELSTGGARGPSMTADRLELYFVGNRQDDVGSYEIYKSVRATVQDVWSEPVPVTELNTSAAEADPCVSSDGLTMWFSTDRDPVESYDIWVSVRASRNDAWGMPTPVRELNTVKVDASPSVTADGLVLAFHSSRAGDDSDIYLSTRATASATWGTPVPLAAVNSTSDDDDPGLSSDGLQLYVTTTRMGGHGSRDLWLARRTSRGSDFGPPTNVAELNTSGLEAAPWISDDDRLIVFSRLPVRGSFGIYEASR